ncbi:MAG: EAL domain-containing protein [Lachnospiraceae bacterium]|nr:EAL domain-containing protein [Lachnospiraceae bacterium]
MWDLSFAIPSLLILGLLLLFYFSLPRLQICMNSAFLCILVLESAIIIADISASYADDRFDSLPLYGVHLLNTVYFMLFFLRAGALFVYTASVLKLWKQKNALVHILISLPMCICVLLSLASPFLGLIYYIDASGYHKGPCYFLVYICYWLYLFISIITWIKYKNNLKRKRQKLGLLLFLIIMCAGIILRQLFPTILLMDTFCLMAVLSVYLSFENPEFYLERRGNVFNTAAFRDYIEENNGHLSGNIVGIVLRYYSEIRDIYSGSQMDDGLTMIAEYLTAEFPGCNVFYHRRGRFIVFFPKSYDKDDLLSRLTERFNRPWKSDNADLSFDAGFIISELEERVPSAEILLATITSGMDKADFGGSRGTVTINRDDMEANLRNSEIKRLLDASIFNDEVEVFLQPLVDAKTEKIVSAEALCRLFDTEGEIISPGSFIGIAERNGRINELGEQVFEKTCRFVKEHDLLSAGIQCINVNLSPVQFLRSDLDERYSGIVKKYCIDPSMVHLEITEESMIDDSFLQKQLAVMVERGFKFSLDDYGTGYSNLTRLKKCPFKNVKLDMAVVKDYCQSPDDILPTMIKAFKQMGFEVTAEGIEDENVAETMKRIGCDYLQGFYYSKPLPMKEFAIKYL